MNRELKKLADGLGYSEAERSDPRMLALLQDHIDALHRLGKTVEDLLAIPPLPVEMTLPPPNPCHNSRYTLGERDKDDDSPRSATK